MISFALVIGLGGIIVAFTINRATYTAFRKMVREGDIAVARELSVSLGSYYEENNSWDGVDKIIIKPYQHIFLQNSEQEGHPRNQMRGRLSEYYSNRGQSQGIHLVITDTKGKVIISSGEYPKGIEIPVEKGVPVYADSKIKGYVFVGSMIGAGFLPFQQEFLKSAGQAIFLTLSGMIFSASIIGFFLIRHITLPVKKLNIASKEIARGNLEITVEVRQNDELGELAASFNTMTASLRKAEQWKRQIIADAAHELRTPLSLIQGRLEMMLDGIYAIDRQGVKLVYDETLMLTKLIKELSELSNAEAGTVHLSFEKHNVRELLDFSAEFFLPKIEEKNISLSVKVINNVPDVIIDLQKMNQVLGNLLSNAIRYTPENGTILLSAWYDNKAGNTCIAVEDSGIGIPESDMGKIFDRFYRVDSHRNRESGGSGLGLAISREIIRLHSGDIVAEKPESGQGTRMIISLPAVI